MDVIIFIIRTAILGIGDHYGAFLLQLFLDIFRIYVIYWKEKDDRKIFGSFYDSKADLVKFKHLITEHLPDSVVIIDNNGRFLYQNESYKRNYPNNDQNAFFHLESFFVDHETIQSYGLSKKISLKMKTVKDIITRINASKIPTDILDFKAYKYNENEIQKIYNMKLFSIKWDNKPATAVLFNDITNQEAISRMRIADANKQRILASVSHELRTPINGMMGILHIMENEIKESHLQKYLGYCKTNCELLLSIVSSILDLNQIRHKTLKLIPCKFKITDLFEHIRSLFEYQCTIKGLTFNFDIDPKANPHFFTDKGRLFQILVNLAGNAVKFTQKGGITMGYRKSDIKENEGILWVSDTGIGIKPHDIPKLFTVYGKVEDIEHNAANTHGVGLGLTISTNLAQLLNERSLGIGVESKYGVGTTFTFPVDISLHEQENENSEVLLADEENKADTQMQFYSLRTPDMTKLMSIIEPLAPTSLLKNFTIDNNRPKECLIVDDNAFNLMAAKHFLALEGFIVHQALNGQEAIEQTNKLVNDGNNLIIIFMDLQMPIMDGYEATRSLKAKMKDKELPCLPIIALSANDQEHDKQKCWQNGLDDHLAKPIQVKDLKIILDKYLYKKNA